MNRQEFKEAAMNKFIDASTFTIFAVSAYIQQTFKEGASYHLAIDFINEWLDEGLIYFASAASERMGGGARTYRFLTPQEIAERALSGHERDK